METSFSEITLWIVSFHGLKCFLIRGGVRWRHI